ncbi:restriction endonuclease subunit S [bacterium]|nr:restriction endonuclease subunit S [bacterium]
MERLLLRDIVELQAGYQSSEKIISEKEGTYRLIQAKDIKEDKKIDFNNLIRFCPRRKPELYAVKQDNVLFQARGFNHQSVHIKENYSNVLAASTFYVCRLKTDKARPGYLAWWLNQAPIQNVLQERAGSSYLSFVSIKVLADIRIELPPIEIQAKIEKIIELKNKEIQLLDELKDNKEKLINQFCINKIYQSGDINEFTDQSKNSQ